MRKLHKKPLIMAAATLALTNIGDYDCFVRVTAFAPVALTYNAPDGGWTEMVDENDKNVSYWCYDDVLPAGKTTEQELNITYKFPEGDDKPEEANSPAAAR